MARPNRNARRGQNHGDRGASDRPPGLPERPRDRFDDQPRYHGPRDDRPYRPPPHDTWRSGPDRRRSRSPRRRSPPRGPRRDDYRDDRRDDFRQGGDTWRPRPPQSDFTFRVDKPNGIADVPYFEGHQQSSGGRGRGKGNPGRRDNRRGGRRFRPVHPSERALIAGGIGSQGEERLGNSLGGSRFRNLEELSDDEEHEMEMSDRSSASPGFEEGPSKKRKKTEESDEAANAAPKWSNPDPYTALPPPDDQNGKKRDVVALIRKARVEEKPHNDDAPEAAENFISFDSTEDEKNPDQDDDESEASYDPAPAASPPPRPLNRRQPEHSLMPPPGLSQPPLPLGPPPGLTEPISGSEPLPLNISVPLPQADGPLGSRKRTADDEIKPPDYGLGKKVNKKASGGMLVASWVPQKGEESCPWSVLDHSATGNVAFRLHKEIIDFYEFVRPRRFEQKIRDNLVENLKKAMQREGRNFGNANVLPFGSFMSGLYLPTADMDIVVCSTEYMKGGPPKFLGAKSWLWKFKGMLTNQRVADTNSIEVISKARVPLVKYVDKTTGLRVDVSFENLGGVTAVQTFLDWKQLYPSMPILVTLIKHFLLMRGLNEPVNGGIGGFSVICLVVSMLQLMPQVQSRNLIPEHHLGEMLLEFFSLYGRHFNYEVNAISLTKPVGYVRKADVRGFTYKNSNRLSIIDPNNDGNDITGGSSNTSVIMRRFNEAYDNLRKRMDQVAKDPVAGGILDVLMEGNYSSFRKQRTFLQHVHEKTVGPCED